MWRLLLKGFACCLRYGCENAAHSLFLLEQIKDTFHPSGDEIKYEQAVSVPGELPSRVQPHPLCRLGPACVRPCGGQVLPGSCLPCPRAGRCPLPTIARALRPSRLTWATSALGFHQQAMDGHGDMMQLGAPIGLTAGWRCLWLEWAMEHEALEGALLGGKHLPMCSNMVGFPFLALALGRTPLHGYLLFHPFLNFPAAGFELPGESQS